MFKSLLADPLTRTKHTRWDAKFVRLDGKFAPYLRWPFPNCKIAFLMCDPLSFFLSSRRMEPTYDKQPAQDGTVADAPVAYKQRRTGFRNVTPFDGVISSRGPR